MTVIEHASPRPPTEKLSVEQFEVIARAAAREDVTLEYLNGQMETRPVPDSDHNAILMWLMRQFMTQRPDLDLNVTGQGLKVDSYRKGRARPDGILAPVDHFAGQGEWADPTGVLAVVEVTSWDSDTNARDRVGKARAYAACDVGVYLLVDRDDDSVTVHSEPGGGRYRNIAKLGYGHTVEIPGVGVTLNTDGLKRYGR
ncbi:Uma2 family endonuclease [Nocardiopsis metallicus]|uniref:Uma2 family endonuclease n=2 Tax=Nocardiopsis metallicus TaxID=179819 RepID=A0A840WB39_9ACTN|nr:Uma2 family endonuclease [Nocardiopsis metallicus]MBB5493374.1 Uma2 family endonuclease [Nocardiopsis metallicus]